MRLRTAGPIDRIGGMTMRRSTGRSLRSRLFVATVASAALVALVAPPAPVSGRPLGLSLPSLALPSVLPTILPEATLPPLLTSPLPTLPPLLPTLPPLLPTPLPTLPPVLPTVTPRLPTPTLPLPVTPGPIPTLPLPSGPTLPPGPGSTATPQPTPTEVIGAASPSPAGSIPPGAGIGPIGAGGPPDPPLSPTSPLAPGSGPFFIPPTGFDGLLTNVLVPGIALGAPTLLLIALIVGQFAVGAAWTTFVRRGLGSWGLRVLGPATPGAGGHDGTDGLGRGSGAEASAAES